MWLVLLYLAGVYACLDKNKDACKVKEDGTDDCRYLNSCDAGGCCVHKDLMPLKPPEAGGTILVFVISGMANAGGIGGGPIMTALEILLFYFNPKQAIPLSQVVIVSGGLVTFAIRSLMRHPTKDRPLLEYHVSMLIIPPILLGSTFGVMVNKVLPNVAILVMLTLVLVYITVMTAKNGIRMYRAESKARKEQVEITVQPESESQQIASDIHNRKEAELLESEAVGRNEGMQTETAGNQQDDCSNRPNTPDLQSAVEDTQNNVSITPIALHGSEELEKIYRRESKQFPIIPCLWIVVVVVYVALGLSIRGSQKTSFAGITFCSEAFKVFFGLWSAGLLILTFLPVIYLTRLQSTYDRLHYEHDDFDIKWTIRSCTEVYIAGFFGGFGGSLLGFGASLLVAPILVQWKVRSPVIGPTAALMTVIGSAISVLQYAQNKGLLDGEYAGWLAMLAFLGAFVGVLSITKLMKRLGRNSLLVLLLAAVLSIAMFLVPIYTLVDIIKKEKAGKGDYALKPYCDC